MLYMDAMGMVTLNHLAHKVLSMEKKTAPVEVGGLSQYLQGFMHPRCCRVASINSMTGRLGSVLVLF